MDASTNLNLPFIIAAQAQKHVTHNEALRALDAVVQLMVLDKDLAAPPGSPADGARYIVAASPTGAWAGQAGKIAAFQDGAWAFYAPREGFTAWVADEDELYVWSGTAWALFASGALNEVVEDTSPQLGGDLDTNARHVDFDDGKGIRDDAGNEQLLFAKTASAVNHLRARNAATGNAPKLEAAGDDTNIDLQLAGKGSGHPKADLFGVNATADATTRFAVKAAASLFDNVGNGHQHKINKAASGDTASLLFQTNFSGRAEMGTAGDDDFHVKVSADGSSWHEAIVVDCSTGAVSLPNTAAAGAGVDDVLATMVAIAELSGDRINVPGGIVDPLDDTGDVDVAGSTNIDTSTAGRIKPTSAGGTEGNAEAPSGTATLGDFTYVDRSWQVDNDATVVSMDIFSAASGTFQCKLFLRTGAGNYDVVVSESFSHPGGGWATHTLSSPFAVPASGAYHAGGRCSSGGNGRIDGTPARAFKAGDVTGTGQTGFTEDSNFVIGVRVTYLGTVDNMQAKSQSFSASSAPALMDLFARIKPIDSIAINTDVIGKVSRDAGTTWASVTFSAVMTYPDSSVLYKALGVSVASQPSGTSMKWRIDTANNKNVEIDTVGVRKAA